MKTLNEVIEKCQENVDLVARGWDEEDCFLSHEYMVDALHYLKEYQGYLIGKEISEAFDEAFTEMYNPPLTWDELKTMEGKPVWVEIENNDPVWAIPMGISTLGDNERMCMVGAEGGHAIHVEVAKDSVNGWQAYRKERNEPN